jgi:hypothetical protein
MKYYFYVYCESPKKNDTPFNPYVHILVQNRGPVLESGDIQISPNLMTDQEIDGQIDILIRELKEVRKEAKRKLKKERMAGGPSS